MSEIARSPLLPPYGPPISLGDAKRVMAAAEKEAEAQGWPMIITILDSGGHMVMQHRMDNANIGGVGIATFKAKTAINFRRPSKVYEDLIAAGGLNLRLLAASDVVAPMEGGIPLMLDGKVIGAIGVSGMASHEDGQVAQAGVNAL